MTVSDDMTLLEYDKSQNVSLLCGVDEAGRGPLAGDVYAAAVILPEDCDIEGLNDSKKLSEKKREQLFDEIIEKAVSYCVAVATVEEIEEHNILNATFLAMNRAVEGLSVKPKLVLVDGNKNPIENYNSRCVVKGDATSAAIAAASILAKVSRDRYMQKIAEQYPEYQFSKHKGYGTKLHYEMLDKYGVSDVHRLSFLKKYFAQKGKTLPNTKITGDMGEELAVKYLKKKKYKILNNNYKTKSGEIDIIAQKDDYIVFVEVKTRGKNSLITPAEAVDKAKQEKLIKTAFEYLAKTRTDKQPRFDVVEIYADAEKTKDYTVNHIENAFLAEGQYVFF